MDRSHQDPFVVRCLSVRYPDGHTTPRHAHPRAQLVFAATGAVAAETAEGLWIVPPGRAVWIPPGREHRLTLWGRAWLRTLYLPAVRGMPRSPTVTRVSPLLRELVAHVVACGGLRRERPEDRRLAAVLRDQLRALDQPAIDLPLPRDARALAVARRLLAEPGNGSPLAELARGSGASPRTLERLFRQETGTSLGRWRRQVRLVHALRRLAEGHTVERVARETGYSTPSAFIAMFRRVYGVSPGRSFRDGEPEGA